MTETTPDVRIDGWCDDRFSAVRDAFAANFASGEDVGASVAASIDGELVLDLWGGRAGSTPSIAGATEPWQRDSIINVWSSTKTMLALAALDARRPGRDRPPRARRAVLAGVRRERQGGDRGPPPAQPHVRAVRVGHAAAVDRGHLRLGADVRAARRAGAVVGAGHRVRLPRADRGLPRRRGDPPCDGRLDGHVLPDRDRRAARRRLPHRDACGRRRPGRRGDPALRAVRRRRRRSRLRGGQDRREPEARCRRVGHPAVAARGDPCGERPRERPLDRAGAEHHLERRHRRRPHVPVRARRRGAVRGPVRGHRPRARHADPVRHGVRAQRPGDAAQPERADVLLGWLGRLDRRQRPRCAARRSRT